MSLSRIAFIQLLRVPLVVTRRTYSVESSLQALPNGTKWSKFVKFHKENWPVMASVAAMLTGVAGAGKTAGASSLSRS